MKTIDDYLNQLPPQQSADLNDIRKKIHALVDGLEETISYGIPTLRYRGKNLIHIAGFADHMSVFPGAHAIEVLDKKLDSFIISKGTIQFTHEHPLSDKLLSEMVTIRRHDIDEKTDV